MMSSDPWSMQPIYHRAMHYSPTMGDLDLDPPRTRIAVACNRCRRRKIKCSGAPEGGSCEGCIRANDAECVFADRPQRPTPPEGSPMGSSPLGLMQPAGLLGNVSRSTSFSNSTRRSFVAAPPLRSSISTVDSRSSSFSLSPPRTASGIGSSNLNFINNGSPHLLSGPARHAAVMGSPTFTGNKRPGSLPASMHPYQRPSSVNSMRNRSMGDIAVARYSQSLIQAQAQQLSGRHNLARLSIPTSVPNSHTVGYPLTVPASQQSFNITGNGYGPLSSPTGINPPMSAPAFRRPDYSQHASSTGGSYTSSLGGPGEVDHIGLSRAQTASPDYNGQSPVFAPDFYSLSTPDLQSSLDPSGGNHGIPPPEPLGSLMMHSTHNTSAMSLPSMISTSSTLRNASQHSSSGWYDYPGSGIDPTHPTSVTAGKTFSFAAGGNTAAGESSQWTPGVEKMKQFIDFGDGASPQSMHAGSISFTQVMSNGTNGAGRAAVDTQQSSLLPSSSDQLPQNPHLQNQHQQRRQRQER